jgi:anti-sigma regulatory factor (Ser/Thr protein kinase)
MNNHLHEVELGSFKAHASMNCWDNLIDFAYRQVDQNIGDRSRAYKLKLAFEELISNIIRSSSEHSSSRPAQTTLKVTALQRESPSHRFFVIRTEDDGVEFNPKFGERASVDTQQHVQDRQIGGLGLFLIQQSVDEVSYEWMNGKNTYELSMAIFPNFE